MTNNYIIGQKDTRPWGTWKVIDCGNGFCTKHITVNSGGILSLQLHHFRSEHWIIVKGTATVTLGELQLEKMSVNPFISLLKLNIVSKITHQLRWNLLRFKSAKILMKMILYVTKTNTDALNKIYFCA